MKKLIAVFDESGTNNQPQSIEDSSFGVGAIIFLLEHAQALAAVSKQIGVIVRNGDFKYRDVQENKLARELFIKALNSVASPVHLYAFHVDGACMMHLGRRTNEAAEVYGTEYGQPPSPRGERFRSFEDFIGYMTFCLGAHAHTNGYALAGC